MTCLVYSWSGTLFIECLLYSKEMNKTDRRHISKSTGSFQCFQKNSVGNEEQGKGLCEWALKEQKAALQRLEEDNSRLKKCQRLVAQCVPTGPPSPVHPQPALLLHTGYLASQARELTMFVIHPAAQWKLQSLYLHPRPVVICPNIINGAEPLFTSSSK